MGSDRPRSSAACNSDCWMPNREVAVEAAGARDLQLALDLALGEERVTSYRHDHKMGAPDRLVLLTDHAEVLGNVMAFDWSREPGAGPTCRLPASLGPGQLLGLVSAFLADAGHYGAPPDIDGSVERGGFRLRVAGYAEGVVVVEPMWREFHK